MKSAHRSKRAAASRPFEGLAPESLPAVLPRESRLASPWEALEALVDVETLRDGAGVGGAVSAGEPSRARRVRRPSPGKARPVIMRG